MLVNRRFLLTIMYKTYIYVKPLQDFINILILYYTRYIYESIVSSQHYGITFRELHNQTIPTKPITIPVWKKI